MSGEDKHTSSYCLGCIYYAASVGSCDYILIEGKRRPCPGGDGCTERRYVKEKNMGKTKWDIQKGFELFIAGKSDREIALAVGAEASAIGAYRRRYWKIVPSSAVTGGTDEAAGEPEKQSAKTKNEKPASSVQKSGGGDAGSVQRSGGRHKRAFRHGRGVYRKCDPQPVELEGKRKPSCGAKRHCIYAAAIGVN